MTLKTLPDLLSECWCRFSLKHFDQQRTAMSQQRSGHLEGRFSQLER
jgi:hypothetical protein